MVHFCTFISRIRRIGINLGQNRLGWRKFQFGYGRPNDYNFDYGFFKALQLGNASQVVPVDKFSIVLTVILAVVFLNETLSLKTIVGCILITIGTLVMI